jgi:molecular chaperone GrpE
MPAKEDNKSIPTGTESSEIERLKGELRHEHEMYLRALADFDNYRRRVERDRASAARSGQREILVSLLEVLDSFDLALRHGSNVPSSVSEGLQALHRKFLGLLEAHGVTPLKTLGETFDPQLHEAVGSAESDQYAPGAVAEEVQRGYRWGEELLRPARVRVAQ